MPLMFHGIFILFSTSIMFRLPSPYPTRRPARPNDFVIDLRMNRLSNLCNPDTMLSFKFESSMKHSSTKTNEEFLREASSILSMFFFLFRMPVGLLGLQTKVQ